MGVFPVPRFGGSWTFIISFILMMAIWMLINVLHPFGLNFDPYPFILLNLALSTIAAIQAPLIMMSQNRAADYDRLQARNDFNVNMESERDKRTSQGFRAFHQGDLCGIRIQRPQLFQQDIQKIRRRDTK